MKYRPRLYELRPITKQVLKVELLKARKRKQSGHTGNIQRVSEIWGESIKGKNYEIIEYHMEQRKNSKGMEQQDNSKYS